MDRLEHLGAHVSEGSPLGRVQAADGAEPERAPAALRAACAMEDRALEPPDDPVLARIGPEDAGGPERA
jgi:hypothetical protein